MRIIPAKPRRQTEEDTFTLIPAPDALMRKALILDGTFEEAALPAIQRAQAAARRVREQSRQVISEEISHLSQAFIDYEEGPGDADAQAMLFRAAQDLRVIAAELEQPLIERIARSTSRLMAQCPATSRALLRAHIDALRAAVRDGIREATTPLASELADELERRTQNAIDSRKP